MLCPERVRLCSSFPSFLICHQNFCHYNTALLWASHSVQDYSLSSIEACSTDVFLVKRHPGLPADIHAAFWSYQQPTCMTSLGSLLLDEVSQGPGPKMPISSVYGDVCAFSWRGDSDNSSPWSVVCILYRHCALIAKSIASCKDLRDHQSTSLLQMGKRAQSGGSACAKTHGLSFNSSAQVCSSVADMQSGWPPEHCRSLLC